MMSATTGRAIDALAHLRQSIRDILTTRIGSRVERRDYGSNVPDLIDQPGNAVTALRIKAAAVMGIRRWEPRVKIDSIGFTVAFGGQATVSIEGRRIDGTALSLGVAL